MGICTTAEAINYCAAEEGDADMDLIRLAVERSVVSYLRWEPWRETYTRYFPKTERGGGSSYQVNDTYSRVKAGIRGSDIVAESSRTNVLILDHKYVTPAGLQVWECSGAAMGQTIAFSDEYLLTLGTDYFLDLFDATYSKTGHLLRNHSGAWPRDRGSVKVTYSAGFTDAELRGRATTGYDASDIWYATMLGINREWNQHQQWMRDTSRGGVGAITSESIHGYSYSTDGRAVSAYLGMVKTLPVQAVGMLTKYRRWASSR